MTKRRWEQAAAAGGIGFVVLQLASQGLIQIGGAEPAFTASALRLAPAGTSISFFSLTNLMTGMDHSCLENAPYVRALLDPIPSRQPRRVGGTAHQEGPFVGFSLEFTM